MDNTWILVANASVATLYDYTPLDSGASAQSRPKLTVIEEFLHPDSRKSDRELTTDREGAYISRGGHGNFVEASDPHQYAGLVFARELARKLEQGRVQHQFGSLMLVAGPRFMGLLRQSIDEHPLKKVSIQEIQKELTHEKTSRISQNP